MGKPMISVDELNELMARRDPSLEEQVRRDTTGARISEAHRSRMARGDSWFDADVRARMSASQAALWQDSAHRERMSAAKLGKTASADTKAKMSTTLKQKWADPVFRATRLAALENAAERKKLSTGPHPKKTVSEKTKAKMSETRKRKWADPEFKNKMAAARRAAAARKSMLAEQALDDAART